jgi:SnoaL-like domain
MVISHRIDVTDLSMQRTRRMTMPVRPEDFIEICDLCYTYATGVDSRDWVLYRSVFTDRIAIDFSSYNGRPKSEMSADDWVSGLKPLFTGLAATQHSMTNPRVVVDGDQATLTMYMQAEHILDHDDPTAWLTIGGYYTDQLRRTAGRWRINEVTLTILWRRGRPDIMVRAAERGRVALGIAD